jgi:hypothetical protein
VARVRKITMIIYGTPLKEIIKKGWDVFPPWLMALNIFAIAVGLGVIIFV